MKEQDLKILIKDNKIITLKDLFEAKQKTRKEVARLPFEEKIRALVDLQRLAYSWGGKKRCNCLETVDRAVALSI